MHAPHRSIDERVSEVAQDIQKRAMMVEGVRYWNRRRSELDMAGMYHRYVQMLCKKKLLQKKTVGSKHTLFRILKPFFSPEMSSFHGMPNLHLYIVKDAEALEKLARGEITLAALPD
jgi:hypothetical protein